MNKDIIEKYMKIAIEEAEKSKENGENPFGAVLLDPEYNFCHKSQTRCIELSDPTAHAETLVIREYCKKINSVYLKDYILICSGEPCILCSGAIRWAKIGKIYYSVPQEAINKASGGKLKPSCDSLINSGSSKKEIYGNILLEEGLKVFEDYEFTPQDERKKAGDNMLKLENIYTETKYLDELFSQQYNIKSPEIIRKYKLELLVEFGELANETRCFKFWSKRQKGDKEKVLEEYIDCLFMILYFCNINDVSLNEKFELPEKTDLIDAFLKLYEYGLCLNKHMDKDIVKKLLVQIIYISELLDFDVTDLEEETMRKSLVIQERLRSDY